MTRLQPYDVRSRWTNESHPTLKIPISWKSGGFLLPGSSPTRRLRSIAYQRARAIAKFRGLRGAISCLQCARRYEDASSFYVVLFSPSELSSCQTSSTRVSPVSSLRYQLGSMFTIHDRTKWRADFSQCGFMLRCSAVIVAPFPINALYVAQQ
ncbi:hypothetical protein F5Y09DRAFT_246023 [Xylaria sp. FL1042]|nr:hypothetical protein F5Y09DRAFT_246023 [Xylaria sp. FL1042]